MLKHIRLKHTEKVEDQRNRVSILSSHPHALPWHKPVSESFVSLRLQTGTGSYTLASDLCFMETVWVVCVAVHALKGCSTQCMQILDEIYFDNYKKFREEEQRLMQAEMAKVQQAVQGGLPGAWPGASPLVSCHHRPIEQLSLPLHYGVLPL